MTSHTLFRSWVGITLVVICAAAAASFAYLPLEDVRADARGRIPVPKELIHFDDGDSIAIHWPAGVEQVRILAIDTPEVQHLDHDLPYAQPFGNEAAGFLRGCIAVAGKIELLRSGERDRYERTLAYVMLDGKNYSVLVIQARLSYGPKDRFGDNGLPKEYAACKAAAKKTGPPAFEEPYLYRRRMRIVSAWMKEQGTYPTVASPSDK